MKSLRIFFPVLALSFLMLSSRGMAAQMAAATGEMRVTALTTNYFSAPLAVEGTPVFRWQWAGGTPGASVDAVQVAVWSPDSAGENVASAIWDSGRLKHSGLGTLRYGGPALEAGKRYFWRVKFWDAQGRESTWSERAVFRTEPDEATRARAKWIACAEEKERSPLLRRSFSVRADLVEAVAHVSAIGYVEPYLNGEKIGAAVMDPAPTQYERRVYFSSYDVTSQLKRDAENTIGLWLNEGQAAITRSRSDRFHNNSRKYPGPYAVPCGWLLLELRYADGTSETVVTDEQWSVRSSALTYAHFYGGEDFDARLHDANWARPGQGVDGWSRVVVRDEVKPLLSPQPIAPMVAHEAIKPVARKVPHSGGGVHLFDFGQNIGGVWRLKVKGKRGAEVYVRGAETMENSFFETGFAEALGISLGYTHGRGGAYERDTYLRYTLKGGALEEYQPRFFYTGFRYAQIDLPNPMEIESVELEAVPIHTALDAPGSFRCSDPRLNQLHQNTRWSIKGIAQGAPMSNPNSEKYGWTGDAHLFAEAGNAIFDLRAFWEKWLVDLADNQQAQGNGAFITMTVPNYRSERMANTAVWGAAYPLIARYQYLHTGDPAIYRRHYEPVKRWAEYLRSTAREDGLIYCIWADHVAPGFKADGTPKHYPMTVKLRPLLGTAFYAETEKILAEMAGVLGDAAAAAQHRAYAAKAAALLNQRFFNPQTNRYEVEAEDAGHFPLQTANLVPLQLGLVPQENISAVLAAALRDIKETHRGHLMTGIIGTKALVEVLIRAGEVDLLYEMATQPDYPGWGFWLANGATTHWQHWHGEPDHNHAMFGCIEEFFNHGIAGIVPPTEPGTSAGWARVRLAPQFPKKLEWAEATVPTPHGLIRSAWKRTPEGTLRLEYELPVGVTGQLEVNGYPAKTLAAGTHRLEAKDGQWAELTAENF